MKKLPKFEVVHGDTSYVLKNKEVSLAVTRVGGQLAPATFRFAGGKTFQPFSLAPWKPNEVPKSTPQILKNLRGDFFCLPFGEPGEGSNGFIHGDPANRQWRFVQEALGELTLMCNLKELGGKVFKRLFLRPGHRAIYQSHEVKGIRGKFPLGYHAILQFPEEEKSVEIRTSRMVGGKVTPKPYGDPAAGEYTSLKAGSNFSRMDRVPLATGGFTSLRSYPTREGYEDIAMIMNEPGEFAWTAATFPGYVWISLKDPRTLASTVFWISNGGRHMSPWDGRHRQRMGIEEVTSAFALGTQASRRRVGMPSGIPSTLNFREGESKCINQIHLVHPVPAKFGGVRSIRRDRRKEAVVVTGESGKTLEIPVQWNFLYRTSF